MFRFYISALRKRALFLPLGLSGLCLLLLGLVLHDYVRLGELRALRSERNIQLSGLIDDNTQLRTLSDRLRETHLDVDFLDERVRDVLGYIGRDELRIFLNR